MKKSDIGLVHDATELRKLIVANPDLPIVVLEDVDADNDYYGWMYCSNVCCNIDYILDIKTPYDNYGEHVFTDKDEFEDAVMNGLNNKETAKLSDAEYEALVASEVAKYAPYWKKVIAVYVSN